MSTHLTTVDLDQFNSRRMPPHRLQAVFEHLEQCAECAAEWRRALEVTKAANSLLSTIEEREHVDEVMMQRYAEGSLPGADRATVEEHLSTCDDCAEGVADFREVRALAVRPFPWMRYAAAAAIIVVAGLMYLVSSWRLTQPEAPRRPAVHFQRPEPEPPVVAQALAAGELPPPPALAELLRGPDVEWTRGSDTPEPFECQPNRVVVDSVRPTFRWSGDPKSVMVVRLFRRDREVIHSPGLHVNSWTPPVDLPRGTYTWQVELTANGVTLLRPAAPDPPAMFIILDEAESHAVATAAATKPDDHLLLGVLCARAGLRDRALEQLRIAAGQPRADPRVPRLLRSVESWGR